MDDNGEDNASKAAPADLPSQSRFRVTVDEGLLAAAPLETLYFEWSIITDPLDIDGQDGGDTVIDVEGAASWLLKKAARSRRFMDAYDRGLNGKQAAWAARKDRGHRVLPPNIFDELEKGGIV
jgi:hypothetical protein